MKKQTWDRNKAAGTQSSWYAVCPILDFHCSNPFGMESGRITDDQITASSSFSDGLWSPRQARLNYDNNAWTPSEDSNKEYIQVSFYHAHVHCCLLHTSLSYFHHPFFFTHQKENAITFSGCLRILLTGHTGRVHWRQRLRRRWAIVSVQSNESYILSHASICPFSFYSMLQSPKRALGNNSVGGKNILHRVVKFLA